MGGNNLFAPAFEKHLAELAQRKADYAAAHPELGPMALRREFWGQESRRRRSSRRKQVNALLKLIKESEPFWE